MDDVKLIVVLFNHCAGILFSRNTVTSVTHNFVKGETAYGYTKKKRGLQGFYPVAGIHHDGRLQRQGPGYR